MRSIFDRLVGAPWQIDEPTLTQMLASVLERTPELARELGRRLLAGQSGPLRIPDTAEVRVEAERGIPQGGRPDLVVEFSEGPYVRAALIIENKINARVTNPLSNYLESVNERRSRGQSCVLVLLSKRYALEDEELTPYREDDRFRYVAWADLYQWIREWCAGFDRTKHWLAFDFIDYLGGMRMKKSGVFTFADIGLSALVPSLIDKRERTINDDQLKHLLSDLSCDSRDRVKQWKQSQVYSVFAYVIKRPWWVSAGFLFKEEDESGWKQTLADELCPLLVAVMYGTEEDDREACLAAIEEKEKVLGILLDSTKWKRGLHFPDGVVLLAYEPVTNMVSRPGLTDHLGACRSFLIDRLNDLRPLLKT